jgi:biopolymer transport protein TolQ
MGLILLYDWAVAVNTKATGLYAAERAMARSAASTHSELKRGLNSLATTASIAPWVGILGTIWGIVTSFHGVDGEKTAIMAALCEELSRAIMPTAFGVITALVGMWCYKYLRSEMETFDSEMECASLQLLNDLARLKPTP